MKILYHSKFLKQYKRLDNFIQDLAEEREIIFRDNPFDSRLKTHKLSGRFEGYYAFSVNYSYRIIFNFVGENTVKFFQVGTHNIYE
ncbi:MAG: type II toxin-antitoxin system mRNA interferase toxin, RelE/StbE family [Patescibacteria group bacterium]